MQKCHRGIARGKRRASLDGRSCPPRLVKPSARWPSTLGGVDALVFTAGIGEHSGQIRAAVCDGLSCLGLELDRQTNASAQTDAVVSTATSRAAILVVTAREDLMMARAAAAALQRR